VNNFAEIVLIQKLRKVTYYSVSINNEEALYDQFYEKHIVENNKKLHHILTWIEKLGNKIGANKFYFRHEAETADASALPPLGIDKEPAYIEIDVKTGKKVKKPNNLRLYCLRANESVVFLFNGDIKIMPKAQLFPNVKSHFKLANKLTELLNQAFIEKQIKWNEDYTDIIVDEDFRIEWD
jgi:hypothetical protein